MAFRASQVPAHIASFFSRFALATLYIGAVIEMRISDSNRIALSERKRDSFGNPLAHLVFSYAEDDLRLLERCREMIRGFYSTLGASRVYEDEVTWSRHHQGACRMGTNPATSVVDPDLQVYDTPNVFVCGSEVFATGGAMQPCLTIVALAQRLGEHLGRRFNAGAF